MQSIRKCDRNRNWSSENEKHWIGRFHSRNIGPKGSCLRGSEMSLLINTLHVQLITFGRFFFNILEGAIRGKKRWMRTSEIAGCYRREDHFCEKQIRNYDKYQENGRHIIRKCEILKQRIVLSRKNLTRMITTQGEHSSYRAIRNDQRWRTWRGDRSSSNIARSDAGRAELLNVPHGMLGNMKIAKQVGDK